jgi:hypothetical protein
MRLSRWMLVLCLSALPILGCGSGGECDRCDSDDDCKDGRVCSEFSDGSRRCGTGDGTTQCRVIR